MKNQIRSLLYMIVICGFVSLASSKIFGIDVPYAAQGALTPTVASIVAFKTLRPMFRTQKINSQVKFLFANAPAIKEFALKIKNSKTVLERKQSQDALAAYLLEGARKFHYSWGYFLRTLSFPIIASLILKIYSEFVELYKRYSYHQRLYEDSEALLFRGASYVRGKWSTVHYVIMALINGGLLWRYLNLMDVIDSKNLATSIGENCDGFVELISVNPFKFQGKLSQTSQNRISLLYRKVSIGFSENNNISYPAPSPVEKAEQERLDNDFVARFHKEIGK